MSVVNATSPPGRSFINLLIGTVQRIPAVVRFEWRRAFTFSRMAWMLALMAFPPGLLLMVRTAARYAPRDELISILIFILSACVVCMMSVFLWATPALSSELEGRSWVYLAVRPYGPIAVLIGKFIVSVSWAIPVGVVSATLSVLVFSTQDPIHLIAVQCGLVVLSCLAYSALFLLIGVIAPKKCMVAGIIYTIVFEVAFALIPAAVNMLTVQHRLRCLLVRWMDFDKVIANRNPVFLSYFGDESSWWHVGVLLGMTLAYLIAAGVILRYREFTAAIETVT